MNKEFMVMEGKEKGFITDENGKINFKNLEFSEESLIHENKEEILITKKEKLKKDLRDSNGASRLGKFIRNYFIGCFLICGLIMILCNVYYLNILDIFILMSISGEVIKIIYKNKTKKINLQLELLEGLQVELIREGKNVNKKLDISKIRENEPVSLIEETDKYKTEIDTLLNNAYNVKTKESNILKRVRKK